jgi:hypothetical protein
MNNLFMFTIMICMSFALMAEEVDLSTDALIIEAVLLMKVSNGQPLGPMYIQGLVDGSDDYVADGNFYKPRKDIQVFGHTLLYVGYLGVDMTMGPNVVLNGSPDEISKDVVEIIGKQPISLNGSFAFDLSKEGALLISSHPSIVNSSLVICAYALTGR